ncbi:MAG: hypothetical protein QM642_00425 [Edaphocola sp.]
MINTKSHKFMFIFLAIVFLGKTYSFCQINDSSIIPKEMDEVVVKARGKKGNPTYKVFSLTAKRNIYLRAIDSGGFIGCFIPCTAKEALTVADIKYPLGMMGMDKSLDINTFIVLKYADGSDSTIHVKPWERKYEKNEETLSIDNNLILQKSILGFYVFLQINEKVNPKYYYFLTFNKKYKSKLTYTYNKAHKIVLYDPTLDLLPDKSWQYELLMKNAERYNWAVEVRYSAK